MIPLSSAISSGLCWSRNGSGYELKLNGEIVGHVSKITPWSWDCVARIGDRSWRFVRTGLLGNTEEIRDENGLSVATFKPDWGGPGTIRFADGETFLLRSEGSWYPILQVTTAVGRPLLRVSSHENTVTVDPPADEATQGERTQDQLTQDRTRWLLMILFALYRMQRSEEDAAMALLAAIG